MRQINLEAIIESTSERVWNSRTILNGREDWADLDPVTKHAVQSQGLPFIAHTVPGVFKEFSGQILATIKAGEELGADADTILMSIKAELNEQV